MDESALLQRIAELERRLDWLYRATGYGAAYPGEGLAAPAQPTPHATDGLSEGVRELARRGRKIEAIKLYRKENGGGLRQAKDVIDRFCATQ